MFHLIDKATVFITLLVILGTSCEKTDSINGENEHEMAATILLTDTLVFAVNNISNHHQHDLQYHQKTARLFNVEREKLAINVFSEESLSQVDRYSFASFGPNGVGQKMTSYLFVAEDSIYLTPTHENILFRCNTAGHLLEEIKFDINEGKWIGLVAKSNAHAYLRNNKYSAMAMVDISKVYYGGESFDQPVEYDIDLTSGKCEATMYLPKAYGGYLNDYIYDYGRTLGAAEERIYVFAPLPYAYVKSKEKVNSYFLKSNILRIEEASDVWTKKSRETYHFDYLANDTYAFIEYDQNRKIYIVGGRKGLDAETIKQYSPFSGALEDKIPVLSIYDQNFSLVGEKALPANQFQIGQYFFRNQEFYLSIDHPKNEVLNENEMKFIKVDITY
jgi:hypothetical protein